MGLVAKEGLYITEWLWLKRQICGNKLILQTLFLDILGKPGIRFFDRIIVTTISLGIVH